MDNSHWTPALQEHALGILNNALAEDLGRRGDVTTAAVIHPAQEREATILARAAGVLAGAAAVAEFFARSGLEVEQLAGDGENLEAGQVILHLAGPTTAILVRERTALNLLGRLSGTATLTARYVAAVRGTNCRILDTRKTTPGLRLLEKYAVLCGGGHNHRFGLHDMVLLKENHITAAGGIPAAVQRAREHAPDLPMEAEVRNLDELRQALELPLDRIMLDNFALPELEAAVALTAGRIELEASGGINLDSVAGVARAGVDCVSVGALTHSAPALDLSLLLDALRA